VSVSGYYGSLRFRRYLCLALALVNLALGYRSALASFVTVAPETLASERSLLGDLPETKARDRKPKPTRQSYSTLAERLARDKVLSRRDPSTRPSASVASQLLLVVASIPRLREGQARVESAQAEPHYLRPSEAVLLSQLPPPL
jgi:hypothetical protein